MSGLAYDVWPGQWVRLKGTERPRRLVGYLMLEADHYGQDHEAYRMTTASIDHPLQPVTAEEQARLEPAYQAYIHNDEHLGPAAVADAEDEFQHSRPSRGDCPL